MLLVHATCPTKRKDLFDLLALLDGNRLRVWVLAVNAWGQRCTWALCVRRETPAHILPFTCRNLRRAFWEHPINNDCLPNLRNAEMPGICYREFWFVSGRAFVVGRRAAGR